MVDQRLTLSTQIARSLHLDIYSMLQAPRGWLRFKAKATDNYSGGPVFVRADTLVAFAPIGEFMEVRTNAASWLVEEHYLSLKELWDLCEEPSLIIRGVPGLTEENYPDIDYAELATNLKRIKQSLG